MERRDFIATGAVAALTPWKQVFGPRVAGVSGAILRPFALADVRLKPGPFLDAAMVNRRFVLGQDPDRLLHTFRLTAGLPTSAQPIGGWEAPNNELRGHFTGHYLSACALLSASQTDPDAKARGDQMVAALADCQKALGNGYLSAFPDEFFERLRADRGVWAP